MTGYLLSPAARGDLIDFWDYTVLETLDADGFVALLGERLNRLP